MENKEFLILERAKVCDEITKSKHLEAFVLAFVAKNRQERWLHLLLHNPKNAYKNSHKLEGHLNCHCSKVDKDFIKAHYKLGLNGVYYSFSIYRNALLINLEEALIVGDYRNAVFSILLGKLGIYFSDEGSIWLCQK